MRHHNRHWDHPVLLLVHNCLEFTKKCIDSIRNQDIPTYVLVIDNASTDGTFDWLMDEHIHTVKNETNEGVSASWNWGIDTLFNHMGYEHVLCPNNDTVLAPWTYRRLLETNLPFVTGVAVDKIEQISSEPRDLSLSLHPDFSLYCMRREAWDRVGKFDERMQLYCSDCAWHVEAQRKNFPLYKASLAYYHIRSSTMNTASEQDKAAIESQASKDRAVFRSIYNCSPGEPAYEAMFLTPRV